VEQGVTLAWQDIYVYTQVSISFPLELGTFVLGDSESRTLDLDLWALSFP